MGEPTAPPFGSPAAGGATGLALRVGDVLATDRVELVADVVGPALEFVTREGGAGGGEEEGVLPGRTADHVPLQAVHEPADEPVAGGVKVDVHRSPHLARRAVEEAGALADVVAEVVRPPRLLDAVEVHPRDGTLVDCHRADVGLFRALQEVGHDLVVCVLRQQLRRGAPAHVEVRQVVRDHLVALAARTVGDHPDRDLLVGEGLADGVWVEADDEIRGELVAVAASDFHIYVEGLAVLGGRVAAVEVKLGRRNAPEAVRAAGIGVREGVGDALDEVREALGPEDEPAAVGGVALDGELDLAQRGVAEEGLEFGAFRRDNGGVGELASWGVG